jgi:two-component system chemotaxis response regulator CheY
MVGLTLTSAGYTVLEAVDGSDGYDKATANAVDAIITDLNMPNMNGIEFIRKFRVITHPPCHRSRSLNPCGYGSR